MVHRVALLIASLLAAANHEGRSGGYDVKREVRLGAFGLAGGMWSTFSFSPHTQAADWAPPGGSVKVWLFSKNHSCTEMELHGVALPTPTSTGDTEF